MVDSTAAVARVWTIWARKHGLDPEMVVKIAHGRPSITTIRELLPHATMKRKIREVERLEIETSRVSWLCPGPRNSCVHCRNPVRDRDFGDAPLAEVRLRAAGLPIPERW